MVRRSGFLDTSVLFAAILSPTGGARAILTLAEQDAIRLWVGPVVLQEAEGFSAAKLRICYRCWPRCLIGRK